MARPTEYGTLEQVLEIYAGVWGAAADAQGADYWVDTIDNQGWSYLDVVNSFFDDNRVQNLYEDPERGPLAGDEFLTALYINIFKVSTPDAEGLAYWQDRINPEGGLDAGGTPRLSVVDYNSDDVGQLVMEMINGMWTNDAAATTQQLYENWIAASVAFYTYQVENDLTPFNQMSQEDQAAFLATAVTLVDSITADSTPEQIQDAVDLANEAVTPAPGVPTYTLEAFLALETPPEAYNLNAETFYAVENATVEAAGAVYAAVVAAIAGAENADDLTLATIFDWTLEDTAANLLAAADEMVVTGAGAFGISDASVTVATATSLEALENFDGVYVLADTLANVSAASAAEILAGAASYALTNAAGSLGTLTEAQVAIVQGATNENDYTWGTFGETITLTTGVDIVGLAVADAKFQTTDRDDSIDGVVSSLPSVGTFNTTDQIDGGAGIDTLKLDMQGSFSGLTGDGKVANVEVLDLKNSSNTSQTFNAGKMAGINSVKLDANGRDFTVSDLAQVGQTFELSNANTDAKATLGYATGVGTGSTDALTLALNDVGAAKTTTVAAKYAQIASSNIETLNVEGKSGTSYVDLSGVSDATAINLIGAGGLVVNKVGVNVASVDGSKASGNLNLDLTNSTKSITSVDTGSGNDAVTLKAMTTNATFAGGTGTDTLVLDNIGGTRAPTISGFETLVIKDLATAGTLVAGGITGLQTLEIRNGLSADYQVSELASGLSSINLTGQTVGEGASTLTLTDNHAVTVNVQVKDDATVNTLGTKVTANAATALTLNVNKGGEEVTDYTGDITANAATSATLNINAKQDGNLTLNNAQSVALNLGYDSQLATVTLNAGKAASFVIDAKSAIASDELTGDLSSVNTVPVTGLANVDLSGITNFGGLSSSVTVDANALNGTFTTTLSDYTGGGSASATITGARNTGNTIEIGSGRNEIAVTGGSANDTVTLSKAITGMAQLNFNLGPVSTGDTVVFTKGANLTGATVTLGGVNTVALGTASADAADLAMKAAAVNGRAIHFTGGTEDAANTLEFVGTDGADTIDFSQVTAQLRASTSDYLRINGGSGVDTITAAGKVQIVDMSGDPTENGVYQEIIGGNGADVIYLNAAATTASATANAVEVVYEATTFGAMTLEGKDVIHNFTDGADVIVFKTELLVAADGSAITVTGALVQNAAAGTDFSTLVADSNSAAIIQVGNATGDLTNADNATAVANLLTGAVDSSMQVVFAVDNGADTFLWYFDGTAGDSNDTTVHADELTLIAQIVGDNALDIGAASFDII